MVHVIHVDVLLFTYVVPVRSGWSAESDTWNTTLDLRFHRKVGSILQEFWERERDVPMLDALRAITPGAGMASDHTSVSGG